MVLLLALSGVARSQTFDAHGPAVPPDGPSVRDPLLGFGGRVAGAPVFGLTGEAANALLVREVVDGGVTTAQPVVDDLFGVGIEGLVPVGDRLAVALTVPLWLASDGEAGGGVTTGDVHAWVPIRLFRREHLHLAAIPFVRLSTGADERYLGEPGPGGLGALASLGAEAGPLVAAVDLGADVGLGTGVADWPGGLYGRFATAVGVAPGEALGLHVEWRGRAPLTGALPSVPSEALLTAKIRPDHSFWLTAGAGTAVTRGIGAALLRMEIGAHGVLGRPDAADGPEYVADRPAELHVIDEKRWPIRGAVATVGGVEAVTDPDGYALLPPRTAKIGRIEIRAEGYDPAVLENLAPDETAWQVVLRRAPVPVTIQAVGPNGALDDVAVAVYGPEEVGQPTIDESGARHFQLRPGTWNVKVWSPGMGSQERTIVVPDDRTEPIRVDAVLAPEVDPKTKLVVEVVDRHGKPVEDAVVAIQDRDFGTTGTGGNLVIHGVPSGETAVLVRSSARAEATVVETKVMPGATNTVRAVLEWPPGSVLVKVTGPDGRPLDARVAFAGPSALPSRSVGSDGEELFVLRPGAWEVLVSSEAFGAQQRRVVVSDRAGEVAELTFVLRPVERGTAELELVVVDLDGRPIADAEVALDDQPVGRTGPDGRVVLLGLDPGERELGVDGALLVPVEKPVELVSGRQLESIAVGYVTGVVDVRVADPGGAPLPAMVAFSGPDTVPPLAVDGDGHAMTVLPPGSWQVAVSNERYGLQVRDLVVTDGDARPHRVAVTMLPVHDATGHLALTVTDPTGQPVIGAKVALDDQPVGTAANGRLELGSLPLGPATLRVEAEALAPVTMPVEIAERTPVSVSLPWGVGAVEVRVKGPSGPVDALVLVSGPEPVSPRSAVGGTVRFGLKPGHWWVLASVPDLAAEEQLVVVPATPGLTVVELGLEPVAPDEALAVVSVRDEEGRPIPGVQAKIAGAPVATSSDGGTVEIEREQTGAVELVLEAPPGYEPRTVPLSLEQGQQDRHVVVLERAPTAVAVRVSGPDGAPVENVTVRATGPDAGPAPVAAAGGTAGLALPPGTWTVTAESEAGVATAEVKVTAGEPAAVALQLVPTGTKVANGLVRLTEPILFDVGQHVLRPEALPLLDDVARRLLVDRTAALIEVQGHTSDEGGVAYNQALSERRAAAVKAALVARGVAPERLIARGYGLTRPVTTGKDEPSRQRNRRVELVVLETAPE